MHNGEYLRSNLKNFRKADEKLFNRVRDCILHVFTKQKIMNVWDVKYKWIFDKQWNFVEWTIYTGNSCKKTGKFYTVEINGQKYDILREWKREYNSGLVEDGKFGEWEVFLEWERCEPNGMIYRWHFDVNTWKLYDWEVIYPDWKVEKIENEIKW